MGMNLFRIHFFMYRGVKVMAVYVGQVSRKNGLGQVRNVTATDDMSFALAFGVGGTLGQVYSNSKIGMLQLEGDTGRPEVAIDPNEMSRIEGLDYARSHSGNVLNFGTLANSLMLTNRTEMITQLRSISSTANIDELSDIARGEIAKLLIGVGNEKQAKKMIATDDPDLALVDTVKRNAVLVRYSQTASVGGVEFTISARGTTSVLVNQSGKLIKVRIVMEGTTAGSASQAGKAYKETFVNIKKTVAKVSSTEDLDRSIRYDPNENVDDTATNVSSLLTQTARKLVRQAVARIENEFADVEAFNPASTKSKLWGELNLTTTEVSQSKLDLEALKAYANGEITALQFANMPKNNLKEKLVKAVNNRLENADVTAFSERILDQLMPSGKSREEKIREVETEVKTTLEKLQDQVEGVISFEQAYEFYTRPNALWETEVISKTISRLTSEDGNVDEIQVLTSRVNAILTPLAEDEARNQYNDFRKRYGITAFSVYDQAFIPTTVATKYVEETVTTIIEEIDDLDQVNVKDRVIEYTQNRMPVVLSSMIVSTFDYDQATSSAKSVLTDMLSRTAPYSNVQTYIWRSFVNQIRRMKEVIYYADNGALDEFAEKYVPDWKELVTEDAVELKGSARVFMKQDLTALLEIYYSEYMYNHNFTNEIIASNESIVDQIADQQTDLAIDEFMSTTGNLTEDNLRGKVTGYIQESFDEETFRQLIDWKMNSKVIEINEEMGDRLVERLDEDVLLGLVPTEYWQQIISKIPDQEVFNRVLLSGDLEGFADTYAPEWKEIAKENKS